MLAQGQSAVAVVLVVVSIVPIWLAQRLSEDSVGIGATRVKVTED